MRILRFYLALSLIVIGWQCGNKVTYELSEIDKVGILKSIESNINEGLNATREKDIESYMSQLPTDLVIYDEDGSVISREMQRENVIRDWNIIDTTLRIMMRVDSIDYVDMNNATVYTYQEWERIMYQRDGIHTDTVLTTQRHEETWKNTSNGWFGYEIKELGGNVFINGKEYHPD